MSELDSYQLQYEEMPFIKPLFKRVGKDSKMSKSNQSKVEAPVKSYNKTRGEHFKDMVIVALVVGIIAFGLGFKFNADRNSEMQSAVKAAQTATVSAETVKK